MKILQVNKFFYPRGGAETYFFSLIDSLKKSGHEVLVFSQKNPKNLPSPQEKFFLPDLDLEKFSWHSALNLGRIFWSFQAARNIKKLIKQEKPDLVHIHNIYHQLSPSILPAIKKAGLPIVMTVHDFKLIDHNYTLRADGQKIKTKNSLIADLILRSEFEFHKLLNIYQKNVDVFLVASEFVKNKLIASGFPSEKIIVLPLFVDLPVSLPAEETKVGNYFIAFGRLDETKGLDTLIRSLALAKNPIKVKIVGDGPEKKNLIDLTWELGLASRVEFVGHKNREELAQLISHAIAAIFPSRVHETFGLGALEAMALGKPVIATKAGALVELINNQENGLLIDVNNEQELAEAMDYLVNNPDQTLSMGQKSLEKASKYQTAKHLDQILAIYAKILKPTTTDNIDKQIIAKFG